MNDEDHVRRIEDIDDLEVPAVLCLPHDEVLVLPDPLRVRAPGMVHHELCFRACDPVAGDVLSVPHVPAELVHILSVHQNLSLHNLPQEGWLTDC